MTQGIIKRRKTWSTVISIESAIIRYTGGVPSFRRVCSPRLSLRSLRATTLCPNSCNTWQKKNGDTYFSVLRFFFSLFSFFLLFPRFFSSFFLVISRFFSPPFLFCRFLLSWGFLVLRDSQKGYSWAHIDSIIVYLAPERCAGVVLRHLPVCKVNSPQKARGIYRQRSLAETFIAFWSLGIKEDPQTTIPHTYAWVRMSAGNRTRIEL